MIASYTILTVAWILFCLLHSVFAALWFKEKAKKWMGDQFKFYRLYYTVFAFVSLAVIISILLITPAYPLFTKGTETLVSGCIVSISGLAVMSVCIIKYFMQLSGIKGLIENKTHNELMITGIHRFVRHPLYSGTFVFIWGLLIIFPYLSSLIADIVVTIYTLIGLHFEEKKLLREFGQKYADYKKRVPMIIPAIHFPSRNRI
jgi:protein-S-isoprenylcysteine O-methyltransferase Ste14